MPYMIEVRSWSGWEDAEWTEEDANGTSESMRFETAEKAQTALEEFFSAVALAVVTGNMDVEENRVNYRVVEARNRVQG
jgi:hypothetical protein